MFIAASLIIMKKQKPSKCPPTDEGKNKIWHIHTTEYYSGLTKKEILLHAAAWMNFKETVLREISHSQNGDDCMIPFI